MSDLASLRHIELLNRYTDYSVTSRERGEQRGQLTSDY